MMITYQTSTRTPTRSYTMGTHRWSSPATNLHNYTKNGKPLNLHKTIHTLRQQTRVYYKDKMNGQAEL